MSVDSRPGPDAPTTSAPQQQLRTAPAVETTTAWLPNPPTDVEKYWYMGRQHRWLLLVQSLSFALIGVSVLRFSLSDTRLLWFLAPFSLYAVALVVSLCSSTRSKRVDRIDHEMRVLEYAPGRYPTVDVFLPSAGEALDVLANTYRHVKALQWPAAITVWVLDDSARDSVRDLAEAHGFEYRTRPDRGRLKKAGNLRFGYEQSEGDLIAIFDADFVPRPDYLHELVPYFEQEDVGIVQSPQFFDTHKGMNWLQRCAGATQELFYRWIQPARDRSNAAICVGTCAIYRRKALDAAGGFAQIGHSEDVHTGVNLMKAGYGLRYVPILVSKGLCPDEVLPFLNQQYRWCTGSMSLLADSTFHENPHISARQRLAFWAGFLYYITTALNVFTTAMPALAMLWLLPQFVLPTNSLYLVGAVLMWLLVLPVMFKSRWRVDVLRVQALYSFAHAVAIFHVLTGRTREWVATGTANKTAPQSRTTPLGVTVLRTAKVWIAVTQTFIWLGLARGLVEFGIGRFWAMILLAGLSSFVLVPILFQQTNAEPVTVAVANKVREVVVGWGGSLASLRGRIAASRPSGGAPRPQPEAGLRRWRPDIQGLRAIAVLLVVLYHANVPGITGGYVGVDVFFVISGFLITGGLLRQLEKNGKISFRKFYAGRFQRLAVPAAVVLVVTVVAVRVWDSLFQVRAVTTDALFAAFYTINYRFASQGVNYQQASGPESPLQHYWSLAVEEQFYLVWPLLLMACAWIFRRRYKKAVVVTIAVVSVASLWAALEMTSTNQPMAYFSLHTRAWELGIGGLLAAGATYLAKMPPRFAAVLSWAGVAGILVSGLAYTDDTVFPGTAALLPVLATAAVIAAGCRPSRNSAELVLGLRPMQGLGKVSYAWYLWHWPMLILFPMILGFKLSWVVQLEVAALSLWVAVMMYHLVESPALRSRLKKVLWLPIGFSLAAVSATTAFAVATTVPNLVGTGQAVEIAAADTGAIMQEVARGTLTQEAPSNLTPALDSINGDQPVSSLDGCHADFLQVDQGDCVYGDPDGEDTMVLVGDSHAQQWLPALDAQAKEQGWKLVSWTKAACPVADVEVTAPQLGNRTYTECLDWRESTLAKIAELQPDIVVVSQSDSVPGNQVTNVEWADATARTLSQIRSNGTPVAYVLDTPVPAGNAPDCVANNLAKVEPCMNMREDAYSFPGRHEQVANTLEVIDVSTVEPIDWFCTDRKCPVVVGNMLVYRDASHVSTPYSAYLAPAVTPLFISKEGQA
ncbi:acyltransferase family protein [Actinotalea ferrariae]|uniref:SGNH hydrolase domain-containing protein n=1 Tax=Actinotalea ferrariae TaxID=1386098 RepID=UPI001C8CAC65|nr:SGNH hydrolase domain-containing protein [Actinotalea ferrariae]MBX9245215.1 acyltransferase family protein [Actinotalea ferrariae]